MASASQFSASVDAWVKKTDARMMRVFKESTKRVISEAQRNIPVDTGFARASIRVSTQSMPQIAQNSRGKAGEKYSYRSGDISTVIASAKMGDKIYAGWTASYVIYLEYGHSKQAPSGFIRIAAMQWRRIVGEVVAEAKARAGAG